MHNKKKISQLLCIFFLFPTYLFSMHNQTTIPMNNFLLEPTWLKRIVKESIKEEFAHRNGSHNPFSLIFNKEVFWGTTLSCCTFGLIACLKYLGFLTKHDLQKWSEEYKKNNEELTGKENIKFRGEATKVKKHLNGTQQETNALDNRLQMFDSEQNKININYLHALGQSAAYLQIFNDNFQKIFLNNASKFSATMKNCTNLSSIIELGKTFAELQESSDTDFKNISLTLSEQNNQFSQQISQFSEDQINEYQNQAEDLESLEQILTNLDQPFEQNGKQLLQLQNQLNKLQENKKLDEQEKKRLKKVIIQEINGCIASIESHGNQLENFRLQLNQLNEANQDTKLQMCQLLFLMKGGNEKDWPHVLKQFIHPVGPSSLLSELYLKDKKKNKQLDKPTFTQKLLLKSKEGVSFNLNSNNNQLALPYYQQK